MSERPAPEGEPDNRSVIEAFPSPPAVDAANQQLHDDILEILQKSHDRIQGEVRQTAALATAAIERVDGVVGRVEAAENVVKAVATKAEQVEQNAAATGQAVLAQVSALMTTERAQSRQVAAASVVMGLSELGGRLGRALSFALDRAPALLALAAAVWLWNRILPDPQPLQLVALGLFGAVVIAPAIWLGQICRKE